MRKTVWVVAAAALAGGAYWLTRDTEPDYAPPVFSDAALHLVFEGDLRNLGWAEARARGEGQPAYRPGPWGEALFAAGEGAAGEFDLSGLSDFRDRVEIGFDVKAEAWTNPYAPGRAAKTMLAISGRSEGKLRHVVFNLSGPRAARPVVAVEAADGAKARLTADSEIGEGWRRLALVVDRVEGRSSFLIDGREVATAEIVPAIIDHGAERLRIGTWHQRNQAFRGLIDNLMIREPEVN